jgi:pimeloyl-ACP methyl ester carboxylesterase
VYAVLVHGIGEQEADFADRATSWLGAALGARGRHLHYATCHWAPIADALEQAFMARVKRAGSSGRPIQRMSVGTLADALVYQSNERLREEIWALLDQCVLRVRGEPITFFGHSLGGLILTDYLRQRPLIRKAQLVTMGCNLEIFTLGEAFEPVPQLTAPGSWYSLWDEDDGIGWPLVDDNLKHVRNVEVSVGGWLGWTGLAHTGYWDSKRVWTKTIPDLLAPRPLPR